MSFGPSRTDVGSGPDLAERIAARFGPVRALTPLVPDASSRTFFRLTHPDGRTRVAMVDPSGGRIALDRMVAAHSLLAEIGVRTAAIEDREDDPPTLLFEDLGDVLLADALPRMSRDDQLRLYAEAGHFAGLIAAEGTARVHRDHPLAFPVLGAERLRAELALFATQDAAGRRGCRDQALLEALAGLCDRICQVVAGAPLRLAHRDFHARNLLVLPGPSLGVVDYQDTLLAPPFYDLASLTRDPYVAPPPELCRATAATFVAATGDGDPLADPLFPWVALQRLLKAIGTYAFQARSKGRRRFLNYLPSAERLAYGAVNALPDEWRSTARGILTRVGFAR